MKKLLAIIVVIIALLALAAGCAKPGVETPAAEPTPITTASVPLTTPTPTPSLTSTTTTSVTTTPTTSPNTEPSPAPGSDEPEEVPIYSWEEAIDHIGETATVTGPVFEAEETSIVGLLVGGPAVPGFFLVQLGVDRESLPEDLYEGHTIAVTGYINFAYIPGVGDGARIYVDDLSQIEITEPSPAPGPGEAEEVPVYSWEKAIDHAFETATVTGPVVAVEEMTQHTTKGEVITVILTLGNDDIDGVLIQMIEFDMESLPKDLQVGQTIAVTGLITERGNWGGGSGARIVVEDLSQIKIID